MPYKYLEDIATADVAFKAWGKDEGELFRSCCDALMNIMARDLETISEKQKKCISLDAEDLEMLLFKFLQELVYLWDAQKLLLRVAKISILKGKDRWQIESELKGEIIHRDKHKPEIEIKAVTMHCFQIEQKKKMWEATVVVDI